MTNKNIIYIIIGIVVIIAGILLYQKSKNDAVKLQEQLLLANQQNANYGGGGWLSQILNSSAISSLAGGFGAGVGTNLGSGKK